MILRCAVCSRPDRAAIDDALAGGESPASIAARLSLPVAGARKHVERHLSVEHRERRRSVVGTGRAPPSPPPPTTAKAPSKTQRVPAPAAAPSTPKPSPLIAEGLPRTREERVLHCMALMASGRWVRGETAPELAAEWGVHLGTLEHISGEASRRVKSHTDGEMVQARLAVALDEGIGLSLKWARTGDSRALGALAQLVRSFKELAVPASFAGPREGQRPVLTIRYPDGVPPLTSADGDLPQPPAGPGPPAPDDGE